MLSTKTNQWQTIRIVLIALSLGGIIFILLKSLIDPNFTKKKMVNNASLPQSVPLANWQTIKSTPIKPKNEQLSEGYQYKYQNPLGKLDIDTHYEIYTDSNVSRLLMVYQSIPPATARLQLKQKDGIGYYSLFEYQDKAYISACINPKGQTTVTEQQFVKNRYLYNWSIPRLLFWTIGQKDLFDGRCLFTTMSIPIDTHENALNNAYQTLETTWFDWYRWWQQNYPSS